jgi:carbon storage regulator
MLVLSRKIGESLVIANEIVVRVLEVKGHRVRLGIQAPPDVDVWREELSACQQGRRQELAAADLVTVQ